MTMAKTSFLPKGLALKKVKREPKWLDDLAQVVLGAPAFRVKVNYKGAQGLQDAILESQKRALVGVKDDDPDAKATATVTAVTPLIEELISDWENATLANIRDILRPTTEDGFAIEIALPDDADDDAKAEWARYEKGESIPFSPGFCAYVWVHSYPDRFRDKIYTLLRNWGSELKAEVAQGNAV